MPGTKLDLRTLTYVAYGLYALGFLSSGFLGIATLASVVLMYLKRADVAGTFYAAHFDWLLRTFWWALLWMAISALAVYIFIGWIGLAATVVWVLYRLIRACWRCWRATRRRITPDADLSPSNQGRLLPALSLAPHLWSAVGQHERCVACHGVPSHGEAWHLRRCAGSMSAHESLHPSGAQHRGCWHHATVVASLIQARRRLLGIDIANLESHAESQYRRGFRASGGYHAIGNATDFIRVKRERCWLA